MGNKILRTPHIDQLYKDATRFTDFQVSLFANQSSNEWALPLKSGLVIPSCNEIASPKRYHLLIARADKKTGLFGKTVLRRWR